MKISILICFIVLHVLSCKVIFSCDSDWHKRKVDLLSALDLAVDKSALPETQCSKHYSIVSDARTADLAQINFYGAQKSYTPFKNFAAYERFVYPLPNRNFDMEYERVRYGLSPNPRQVLEFLSYFYQHPPAQFWLSNVLLGEHRYAEAYRLLYSSAYSCHPLAQTQLGLVAFYGKDYSSAKRFFDQASEPRVMLFPDVGMKGLKKIVYNSALMDWASTKVIEQNFFVAEILFHQCVERGHCDMLCNLGIVYDQMGDQKRALEYYTKTLLHLDVSAAVKNKAVQCILAMQSRENLYTVFDPQTNECVKKCINEGSKRSGNIAYIGYKIYRDGWGTLQKNMDCAKIFFLRAIKNGFFLYDGEMSLKSFFADRRAVTTCVESLKVLEQDCHPDYEYAKEVIAHHLAELASGKQPNLYAVVQQIQSNTTKIAPEKMMEWVTKLTEAQQQELLEYVVQTGCLQTIIEYTERHSDNYDLIINCSALVIAAVKNKLIKPEDKSISTIDYLMFEMGKSNNNDYSKSCSAMMDFYCMTGNMPSLLIAALVFVDNFRDLEFTDYIKYSFNQSVQRIKQCADNEEDPLVGDASFILSQIYSMAEADGFTLPDCIKVNKKNLMKAMKCYSDKAHKHQSVFALLEQADKSKKININISAELYYKVYLQLQNHPNPFMRAIHEIAFDELVKMSDADEVPPLACLARCVVLQDAEECLKYFQHALQILYRRMISPETFEEYTKQTQVLPVIERIAAANNLEANYLLCLYFCFVAERFKESKDRLTYIEQGDKYASQMYKLDSSDRQKDTRAAIAIYMAQLCANLGQFDDAFSYLDRAATFGNKIMEGEALYEFAEMYSSGMMGEDSVAGNKCIEFLEQAAVCGDSISLFTLGTILIDGGLKVGSYWHAVEKNEKKGIEYLEQAAPKEPLAAAKLEKLKLEKVISLLEIAGNNDAPPQIKMRALCNYIILLMDEQYTRSEGHFKLLIDAIDRHEALAADHPEYKNLWFDRGCYAALQSLHHQNFALSCRQLRFYVDRYLRWGDGPELVRENFIKPFINILSGNLTEHDGGCLEIQHIFDEDFKLLYESLKKLAGSTNAQPCDVYAYGILTLAAAYNNKHHLIYSNSTATGKKNTQKNKQNESQQRVIAVGFQEIKKAADAGDYLALYFYLGLLVSPDRNLTKAISNRSSELSNYLPKLRECANRYDEKDFYYNVAMLELKAENEAEACKFLERSLGQASNEKNAIAHGYLFVYNTKNAIRLFQEKNKKKEAKKYVGKSMEHAGFLCDLSIVFIGIDDLIIRFMLEEKFLARIDALKRIIDKLDAHDPEKERLDYLYTYCYGCYYALHERSVAEPTVKNQLLQNAFTTIQKAVESKPGLVTPIALCLYAHYLLHQQNIDERLIQELLEKALRKENKTKMDTLMIKNVMDELKVYRQKNLQ